MLVRLTATNIDDIYTIPLNVETKYNYKGEYDGTDCASVISLTINESYNFTDDNEPVSLPYLFNVAVEGSDDNMYIITGRNLSELSDVLKCLTKSSAYQGIMKRTAVDDLYAPAINQIVDGLMGRTPETQPHYNIRIYGHQLQFQTLRNLYEKNFATEITSNGKIIRNVFSRSPRTFMSAKAVNVFGYCDIQFIETEYLVKKSLKDWAEDEELPVNIFNVDITDIKTPITNLTADEIELAENNTLCINYGIQKFRNKFESLANIPFTATGVVRKELREIVCKDEAWGEDEEHGQHEKPNGSRWSRLCARVNRNMTEADYARLRQIFTGGLCFSSRFDRYNVLHDIDAYDIRSAYVSCMCHFKFPVTEFESVPSNQWNKYLNEDDVLSLDRKEAWYGHFVFHGLKSKGNVDFWTFYKYRPQRTDDEEIRVNDGRLIGCKGSFEVYLTDLDFQMFKKFYTFDSVETLGMWKSQTSLLPENLIDTLLKWYKLKSELPRDSRERDEIKVKLASVYGILVTRLYDDDTVFYEGWRTYHMDGKLFKDKRSRISSLNTIGSYQIGVYIVALQRYILGSLIDNNNTYYGDTDSLFGHFNNDQFDDYHMFLNKRRRDICKIYQSLEPEMFGNLGYMEKENHFEEFKFLGQKRYSGSYYEDGVLKIKNTIAGLPKANAGIKIKTPRDLNQRLEWNAEESGLLTKVYNDEQPNCTWIDRDGNLYEAKNIKFGAMVHKTPFIMSSTISKFMSMIEFLNSTMYSVQGAPDPTDPLYIKEALDD